MTYPLWITYAWVDNVDGDFDFLVQELGAANVEGRVDLGGAHHSVVGCGDPITSASAAYLVFQGPMPQRVYFAIANGPLDISSNSWWPLSVGGS